MFRALFLATFLATPAAAQSAFDDFTAKEEAASPERQEQSEALRKFSEILNGSDRSRALDALAFMLAREESEFYNFATEFGVFSTDPEMRGMALQALLERRRQHRLILDTSDADPRQLKGILDFYYGAKNPALNEAYVTITTTPYDPEADCWKNAKRKVCAFILTGDAISLRDWEYVTGSLELTEDGDMVGTMDYRNGDPIPVRMQIIYE
jgi:hypothetical protein